MNINMLNIVNDFKRFEICSFLKEAQRLLIMVCAFSFGTLSKVYAQPPSTCINSDFEQNNFTGWSGQIGSCCPIATTPSAIITGRHTIMTSAGTDPNTCNNVTYVAPGGLRSARLGNSNVGAEAERLSYTFAITAINPLVIYKFAVVLQDPAHAPPDQPRFEVKVLNQSGQVINPSCGAYNVVSGPGIPGFKTCNSGGVTRYSDWTSVGLNLSAYVGQNVTVIFSTGDCKPTGHYGYAYIDAYCSPLVINTLFCGGAPATITAPSGFTYLWSTGATSQSTTIANPVNGQTVTCQMTSTLITTCTITLTAVLQVTKPTAAFTVTNNCGNSVVLADNSTTPGGTTLASWLWDFGDGSTSTLQNPTHVYNPAGTYSILQRVTNSQGCIDTISQQVTTRPAPVATATPASQIICSGGTTAIALASSLTGTVFNWTVVQSAGVSGGTSGNGTSIVNTLVNTGTIAGTAVYTITPTAGGCAGQPITVTITVRPLDDASFNYSSATYCQTGVDPSAVITGLSGGVLSSTAGLVFLNTSSGLVDLSASAVGVYTITYTTNGICPNTSTFSFTLIGAPVTGFSYAGSPFCQFGANPSPTFISGAFPGTFSAIPAGLFFVNVNTGVIDLATSAFGTYAVKNVNAASGGCAADSSTTIVTISPTPVATATPSPLTICSGTSASIAITSNLPGTTYVWTVVETLVSGGSGGIGSSINQTMSTTTAASGTAVYTIIPTVGSCVGAPLTSTVTVNPLPVATAAPPSQTFCSGGTTSIALTSNIPGSTFSWTASAAGVAGATFGAGPTIAQTLTTTGSLTGTVTYMVTPTASACPGNATSITVTVNPPDDASFLYTSATYCQSGSTQTPAITGLPGGIFVSTPAGLSISSSTGAINLSASTVGAYTLSYITNGICPDTSSIIMTITNANPSANFSYSDTTFCQNASNPSPIFVPGSSAGIFSASPSGLAFVHVNTGEIDLAASSPGTYTVTNTIPPSGTCLAASAVTTVIIISSDNASFTYSSATYCISGPNQLPTISGLPGGVFTSSPAGLSIDSLTGSISLSTSLLGMYTVSYSTNGPCPNTSSITMTIDSVTPSASFTYAGSPFCQNGNDPSPVYGTGASAGTYSASPFGLVFVNVNTGQVDLSSTAPGTYVITNTIPASGTCLAASDTSTITITAEDDASFVYSSATYCLTGVNPTPAITGLSGGVFSSSPAGLSLNPATGAINLATSALGAYALVYTTNGPCQNSSTITMTITTNNFFAGFNYSNLNFCQNGSNPLPVYAPGASAGIFSVTPVGLAFVNLNTGEINLALSAPGNYIVTNTIPASGGCAAVIDTTTVTITISDDASFVYTSATYCISGGPQTPVITGLPGGIFSATPVGLAIDSLTGVITLTGTAVGVYTLSYTTNGSCSSTSSITMTIDSTTPFASFNYAGSSYCQNGTNPFPTFGPGASAGIFSANPGGLVFVNVNTGELDLAASTAGTYTVSNTIPASGTCGAVMATSTVVINSSDDASFVYSSATYCLTGPNQTPVITGLTGGVFASIPPGLSLNPATGEIDLTTSAVGAYTLSYSTNSTCPNTSSITMTITSTTLFADFSYPGSPFCQNAANPYPTFAPGASAGLFSASPLGLVFVHVNTGEIDLAASTPGTYTVTNTIPSGGGCAGVVSTYTVTISPADDASFVYTSGTYCISGGPQTPVITGLPGGTFIAVPAGLSINPSTGGIILSSSAVGVYTLSYTTTGACSNSSSITMTIGVTTPFADFSYPSTPFCQNGTNPLPTFGPGASAGIFSCSPGGLVFVQVNTGEIDLLASTPGTYTVSNTIPVSGTCGTVTATSIVVINGSDDASFVYSSATYCLTGSNQTPVITGLQGGTFSSIPPGLSFNSGTGEINMSTSLLGAYTLSYTTGGTCPNTSSIVMTITSTTLNAEFSYPGSPFCQNGTNPYPTFVPSSSAGIFSASPAGLVFVHVNTGQINLSASTPGTYTVTNMIPAGGGCTAVSETSIVTINPPDNTAFTYSSATYCTSGNPQTPAITGLPGGTFLATPAGLSINPATGVINLSTSTLGVYSLSYMTNGSCPDTSSITMTITNTTPFADFSYPNSPFCQYGADPYPTFGPGASAGTFTSSPAGLVFVHVNTGQINIGASAPGTYTITNTIPVSGTCGAVSATSTVVINTAPVATAVASFQNICTGGTATIILTSSIPGTTFSWTATQTNVSGASTGQDSIISQVLTLLGTNQGNVIYTITPNSNGCVGQPLSVLITVNTQVVVATFTPNPTTGETPLTVNFTNSSAGAATYLWDFGNGDTSSTINPSYVFELEGGFIVCLTAISTFNCSDTACTTINVFNNSTFIIPNVFTPNGDNMNDVFTIQGVGLKSLDIEIFNRWGQKESEWHTTNGGWDGRTASGLEAADGTYYYMLKAEGKDGKKYFEKGSFSLVRSNK